jgi:CheY-like chemotaxis protein
VTHANTIASGIRIAQEISQTSGLDLLISDLGLPDGSGLDLMRELSRAHGLRGIASSGFGMEADLEQSEAAGLFKHLIKPVDITALKAVILELTGASGNS